MKDIISHKIHRTHGFYHTVALSLELLRSFARRTHREVSNAFVNTAPAIVPLRQGDERSGGGGLGERRMVDNGFIHPLPPSGYSHLSQGESQLRKHCASNCLSTPILGIINDEYYSINWFHMIKQDLSLLLAHIFTRWPLAAVHDGLRMKTRW